MGGRISRHHDSSEVFCLVGPKSTAGTILLPEEWHPHGEEAFQEAGGGAALYMRAQDDCRVRDDREAKVTPAKGQRSVQGETALALGDVYVLRATRPKRRELPSWSRQGGH